MKRFLLAAVLLGACQTRAPENGVGVLLIRGAQLLTMESEAILPQQDVLIRDGLIVAVGPGLEAPPEAFVIEAKGKVLMPALADMHVHIQNEQDLIVLAAQGIALVRSLHASDDSILDFRRQAREVGAFLPEIAAAGPLFDGPYESHKGAIREAKGWDPARLVEEQKSKGYDFVKVYDALSQRGFREVVAAAGRANQPFVGHVPYRVGLHEVLKAKPRSLEHLSGFAEAIERRDSPYRRNYAKAWKDSKDYWNDAWLGSTGVRFAYVDESQFTFLAKATKQSEAWVCPTLIQRDTYEEASRGVLFEDKSQWRYFPPVMLKGWQDMVNSGPYKLPPTKELSTARRTRRAFVGALHAAGVKLLLGTDIGNVGILPGYSVYHELANLRESGLSSYEALLTATRNASEFLGRAGGIIAPGKIADLILLPGDPLKDPSQLEKREGIVLRGAWYPRAELDRRMERLANGYRAGTLRPQTYFGH
jgi:hypothetical protein